MFMPETLNDEVYESNENTCTTYTACTGAGSSGLVYTSKPTRQQKSADEKERVQDSLLSKSLAANLENTLVLDETTGDWFKCSNGIWSPISKVAGTKMINRALHDVLPFGFSMSKLNAVEGFLKLYLSQHQWEADKSLLPLKNGVLDTKTLTLSEYVAQHKFNWQLPYAYDSEAKISVIKQWLWEVSGHDVEVINIIRAFFRITLIGGEVQKFLEIVGPGGTGKSTLIRLLIMFVGESNHAATDLKNLEQNRFEAATLYGKRLAVISDSSRYGGEVSVLKAITGGDPIRHERKNQQQSGSFLFEGVVVIASNEAIQSTDYSSGLARRRMPITFVRKVTDEDKAKWRSIGGIEKAMQAELPGLLNWVLGMTDDELHATLSSINGSLSMAQRQHFVETNKLAAWIDDNLIIKDEHVLHIGASSAALKDSLEVDLEVRTKLYPNYARWCTENGVQALAVQRFTNSLLDVAEHCKLPVKKLSRDSSGNRVSGLKIRSISDIAFPTPITKTSLNAQECSTHVEATTSGSRRNAGSVDNVGITLSQDMEVF
ncbi:MAG: DNA primase family protein [Methylobacter sp.]